MLERRIEELGGPGIFSRISEVKLSCDLADCFVHVVHPTSSIL